MRILVTGGAGFIGSHIVDLLQPRGHDVTIIDISEQNRVRNLESSDRVLIRDITEPLTDLGSFDAICHQAAQPSLRRSIDDPAHDAMVNIIGTINVIQAAKACGAHVVFASTSAVYDPAGGVFIEDSPIMPNLPYGIAKATAELYLRHSGVSHAILRYGNVYGPRQVQVGENQLIPHCLAHILDGQPFVINGDGEQTRDFVYVGDIARANVLALENRTNGTFNCGTGRCIAVAWVCEMLAMATGHARGFAHGPAKPGEARYVTLDSQRAADVLGWRAETTIADGLSRTVAWWKERST